MPKQVMPDVWGSCIFHQMRHPAVVHLQAQEGVALGGALGKRNALRFRVGAVGAIGVAIIACVTWDP